jgi:hypothetical protein
MGRELDSLADVISFGVAPALVVFSWSLQSLGKIGWICAFIYAVAAAFRLARFNVQLAVVDKRYFVGLASPLAAAIIASMVWAGFDNRIAGREQEVAIGAAVMTVIAAFLMVSNVKYYSFKELDRSRVPFAVMLPDMLMMAEPGALAQAVAAFDQVGGNIVVVEPAPEGQAHRYGIVALDGQDGRRNRMTGMVEKPAPGTEPSNLFISGRYILQPEIFERLARHRKGAGGEIQLTDAMADLMADQAFHALEYDGTTYDCGDKLGLLRANVAYALKRPDQAEGTRAVLKDLLGAG